MERGRKEVEIKLERERNRMIIISETTGDLEIYAFVKE